MLGYIKKFKGKMILTYNDFRVELKNDEKTATVHVESKSSSRKIHYKIDDTGTILTLVRCDERPSEYTPEYVYTPESNSFHAPRIESTVLSDLSSMLTIMGVR